MSWAQLVIATNATYIAHLSQSVDDDLRNTDNAWIESMILSYHDSSLMARCPWLLRLCRKRSLVTLIASTALLMAKQEADTIHEISVCGGI